MIDEFERGEPGVRVVRVRPALIFKRDAATEIRRLFLGPFVPRIAFTRRALAVVPDMGALRFQAVHTEDVADAVRRALVSPDARGPFNLAADPVLDPQTLSEMLAARAVPVPRRLVRGLVTGSWRARLQPSPPGWLDMALGAPLMSSGRARIELGWTPHTSARAALDELLDGLREGSGFPTPPLDPRSSGPLRVHELRTGIGARAY
jgi:UDP-glucose 4-epimerase